MDLLDTLLADAKVEAARLKAAKAKGQPAPAPSPESFYTPHRLVAMFYRSACVHCDTVTLEFEGLFEERRHVRTGDLHLVRQPFIPLESSLPRAKKYLPRDVPYCPACIDPESYQEE